MYKTAALIIFIFLGISFAQRAPIGIITGFYAYPTNDGKTYLYLTYKINYDFIVFVKTNGKYESDFEIFVEITDSLNNYPLRESRKEHIKTEDYIKDTKDRAELNGFFKFRLDRKKYNVFVKVEDKNSKIEQNLLPYSIDLSNIQDSISEYSHLIIKSNPNNNVFQYQIKAFGNKIPFSTDNFDIFIPINDTSINQVNIQFKNKDTSFAFTSVESKYFGIEFKESEKELFLVESELTKQKIFIFKNISNILSEGDYELIISDGRLNNRIIKTRVVWFNKPISLREVEIAILSLKAIENEYTIANLLKGNSEEQTKKLEEYWRKIDPTPESRFNELMNEYYSRVDYCINNFSILGKLNGFETDRGLTYLKYGNPDIIERGISEKGKIIEMWKYKQLGITLNFIDRNGNGNFQILRQ